jgi:hypothetical protein
MSFVWISEQTVTFALHIINRLFFITDVCRVFRARYGLSPYITQICFVFKGLNRGNLMASIDMHRI